ncbi:Na+/H+ antiporter subunit D [Marivirga lumbricoides]
MQLTEASILLPLILPFLTATICLFFNRSKKAQHFISIAGACLLLITAFFLLESVKENGIMVTQIGGWEAPFGITMVMDIFSAIMVLVTAFVGLMVNIYALQNIKKEKKQFGFFVFFHFLIMGVNGAFTAGDIFNLYVWFEILLIASFILLALGNGKEQLIGTVKYMLLSFIASAFLLVGVGIIYGISGSLNMANVAVFCRENPDNPLITVAAIFFLLPFGIKAALFPMYFWLPASYPTPDISVTAFFSGLLTKVGVYALIRFFTLIFVQDIAYTHTILLIAAAFTMFSGVLGALSRNSMRKVLSFHIISQIGYMILGLALFTPLALAGAIFYMVQHILVKTNLFMITGLVEKIKGTSVLKNIGGLYKSYPFVSLLFFIAALSLAGIPPFSGFWPKFLLIKAGFEAKEYWVIAIGIVTGLLTLFSMTKIWVYAFWEKEKKENENELLESIFIQRNWRMTVPVITITVMIIGIGFYSMPLMKYASLAAEQLMNPSLYIQKVLGK